jgi:hypothetical protein
LVSRRSFTAASQSDWLSLSPFIAQWGGGAGAGAGAGAAVATEIDHIGIEVAKGRGASVATATEKEMLAGAETVILMGTETTEDETNTAIVETEIEVAIAGAGAGVESAKKAGTDVALEKPRTAILIRAEIGMLGLGLQALFRRPNRNPHPGNQLWQKRLRQQ